ncbi:arrestin-related substrate adaptor Any1 [Schizosaccharomyces pombe]|uniref:Uncharacterized protein C18H10.20c n=1 Tax=Schizosaccharomyces pombe (strain 972 / ATCC 24843) TaxID=284812 RepID=YNSK_SCHPO|nr:putative endocytosis regulator [Schizosaccharomyces pombe]O60150.1 RecName: Full=Uncharacterized protein C18H10.20c [Schizosaccharomyces pombe 972h-]CAA18417.1 endocytosis regulator (predicted) [Schizosaccharomyces pombe]|eukprot:NP_595744.1 putative endocytosis regulator [Schizosaccharomyces pombe]
MPLKLALPRSTTPKDPARCTLDIRMESPPLVFLGSPETSSGALASGILKLTILHQPFIKVHTLKLQLIKRITVLHPAISHCSACAGSKEVLQTWDLAANTTYRPGTQHWPFSWLFPGSLPASVSNRYIKLEYYLEATLCYGTPEGGISPSKPEVLKFPLQLKRAAIPSPDTIHKRIFPPTNLVANITLPSTLHPHGAALMEVTMTGFAQNDGNDWKINRVTWRLEEHMQFSCQPCERHRDLVKPRPIEEKRILSTQDLQSGWKFIDNQMFLSTQINTSSLREPSCDVEIPAPFSLKVSHHLIFETIVNRKKNVAGNNMGNARILRVSVVQPLTTPAGLGISWDEECPPVFESVGPAPPAYT